MFGAQLAEIGPHQPGQSPVLRQQLVGQLQSVVAAGAGAQDDGQQLGQRERLGAEMLQALARALVAGHFAHGRVVVQFRVFVRVGVRFEGEHAVVFLLRVVMGLPPHIPQEAGKRGNHDGKSVRLGRSPLESQDSRTIYPTELEQRSPVKLRGCGFLSGGRSARLRLGR